MQKLAFILLLITLVSCDANKSSSSNQKQTTEKPAITEISVDEAIHDFGQLQAGEIVLHTFVLTNNGNSNFIIKSLETDCGCVKANFNNKPVKPGKNALIEVEFNTAGLVGREYKTIEVLGNSKELKHLAIFAQVENELIDIKY
ncbi:DUF1573 domain-containing protein [Draconibacterium halophilum]|uniref:DUF1573 domain-containing protein n=1 Tax=Draconibacterium halophilum TaxID=2706887 RepID=A0A6C0RCE9_9BACT|nr:DUF1573 domain-containing protein [Draconibacterium halophilum]QIA07779.1 DUF1573 domain-containing protein [Draconibacterium halophilum]